MTFLRSFYVVAFICSAFGSLFGQVVTKSTVHAENVGRPDISSVVVENRDKNFEQSSKRLQTKIAYAIDDEFVLNGFLPVLRTRPVGTIVSFYLESGRDSDGTAEPAQPDQVSLVVECRDPETTGVIWRGVASVMAGLREGDGYRWESRLTEAARMLVRRFTAEVPAT
jgi:hypothetical protein